MDTLFKLANRAVFPSRGYILDTIIQALGINLKRKEIQRFIEEESISPEKYNLLIDDLVEQILVELYQNKENIYFKGLQKALHSFLVFYPHFVSKYEVSIISQKLLDYLLLKDLFVPLSADIGSLLFKDNPLLILEILPTKEKLPILRLFDLIEQKIVCQKNISQYLIDKFLSDTSYNRGEDTIRHNISNWLNGKELPEIKFIDTITKYLEEDLKDIISQQELFNLFVFARLIQKAYIAFQKVFEERDLQMLIEHFVLLLKFYYEERRWKKALHENDKELINKAIHYFAQEWRHWFNPSLKEHQEKLFYACNEYIEHEYSRLLPIHLYQTYLNHIDKNIINRDFYFDSYFLFIRNILYSSTQYLLPKDMIEEAMKRNGILYQMNDDIAFKYMPLFLPLEFFIQKVDQNIYKQLQKDYHTWGEKTIEQSTFNLNAWRQNLLVINHREEKIRHLKICLYSFLMYSNEMSKKIKHECEEIFELLRDEFNEDEYDANICLLKAKYYAFFGNPEDALKYYKKSVEYGKLHIGEHLTEMMAEGILIAAKCKNKQGYNFFEKKAQIGNITWKSLKKVYRRRIPLFFFGIDEKVINIDELSLACDEYFLGIAL